MASQPDAVPRGINPESGVNETKPNIKQPLLGEGENPQHRPAQGQGTKAGQNAAKQSEAQQARIPREAK